MISALPNLKYTFSRRHQKRPEIPFLVSFLALERWQKE